MKRFQKDVEKAFDDFFRGSETPEPPDPLSESSAGRVSGQGGTELIHAPADLYETEKEIHAEFDLPGVEKEDIDVHVDRGHMEVRAEKRRGTEVKKENAYLMERSYTGFYRRVPLPEAIRTEGIRAEYRNGVLTVHIPKDETKRLHPTKVAVD